MVIGGGFYDHIRDANARFIETANKSLEFLEPREMCPIPMAGHAVFYVRTDSGIFGQGAAIQDLSSDGHVLSPLYRAGFEVFEQLREIARAQKKMSCANTSAPWTRRSQANQMRLPSILSERSSTWSWMNWKKQWLITTKPFP